MQRPWPKSKEIGTIEGQALLPVRLKGVIVNGLVLCPPWLLSDLIDWPDRSGPTRYGAIPIRFEVWRYREAGEIRTQRIGDD